SAPAFAPVTVQPLDAAGASSVSTAAPVPPLIVPLTLPPEITNRSTPVPPVSAKLPLGTLNVTVGPSLIASDPPFGAVIVQTLSVSGPTSVFAWFPPVIA